MKGMERREALKRLSAAPVAAGYALSEARAERAHDHVHARDGASEEAPFERRFFDDHEWATVRVLSDLVIPADDRSGGATDAKVPEFIDVILTDVNMPNMDGIELIRQLRGLPQYKFTPMLLLTTESGADKKAEGKAAGATGWLVKPFNPDQLLATLSKVLG